MTQPSGPCLFVEDGWNFTREVEGWSRAQYKDDNEYLNLLSAVYLYTGSGRDVGACHKDISLAVYVEKVTGLLVKFGFARQVLYSNGVWALVAGDATFTEYSPGLPEGFNQLPSACWAPPADLYPYCAIVEPDPILAPGSPPDDGPALA